MKRSDFRTPSGLTTGGVLFIAKQYFLLYCVNQQCTFDSGTISPNSGV